MDAEKICRLCGYDLYEPRNIYATPGLFGKISRYTDLQVKHGDGFSSSICELCDFKLQMTDNFRLEINRVYEKTREYLVNRIPESYGLRSSAFARVKRENGHDVTERLKNDHHLNIFSQKNDRRFRIQHERMDLFRKRPQGPRFTFAARKSDKSLINSYEEAKSLVASYKALINRYDSGSYLEECALSSTVPIPDNESYPGDENLRLAAAARCRTLEENYSMADEQVPRETATKTPEVLDLSFQSDPLNLLKIKSVRPLRDADIGTVAPGENYDFHSDSNSSTVDLSGTKDFHNRSSDSATDLESSDEEEYRMVSSASSQSSVNIIEQPVTPSVVIRQNNVAAHTMDRDSPAETVPDSKCPVCARVCVNSFGLGIHMRTHMSTKCQICEAPTPTKEKFKEHMQSHMTTTPRLLAECTVCKKTFNNKMNLSVHMRVHTKSVVPERRRCPQCKKMFASYRGYRIHVAKSHSGYVTK